MPKFDLSSEQSALSVAVFHQGTVTDDLLGQTETLRSSAPDFDFRSAISVEHDPARDTLLRFVVQDMDTGDVPTGLVEVLGVSLQRLIKAAPGAAAAAGDNDETVTLPLSKDGRELRTAKLVIFKSKLAPLSSSLTPTPSNADLVPAAAEHPPAATPSDSATAPAPAASS
jgi:hypothetical protein